MTNGMSILTRVSTYIIAAAVGGLAGFAAHPGGATSKDAGKPQTLDPERDLEKAGEFLLMATVEGSGGAMPSKPSKGKGATGSSNGWPQRPSDVTSLARKEAARGRSAVEIMDGIKTAYPKLAKTSPELMLKGAMEGIAERDPQKAASLILDKAPGEQSIVMMELLRSAKDPRTVYGLFSAIPHVKEMGPLQSRFEVWSRVGKGAYASYGEDYVDWVSSLPGGVDRDMALSALAAEVEKANPEQAAKLRSQKSPAPATNPAPATIDQH